MKAPTTVLAERAMARMEQPADGLKEFREAAQAQITEPVIDASLFSRPASYAGNTVATHFGPIAGMLLRKSREIRESYQCSLVKHPLNEAVLHLLSDAENMSAVA